MPMNGGQPWIWRSVLPAAALAAALGMASSSRAAAPDDTAFHATSTVAGLKFILLDTLPEAPRVVGRELCGCVADPKSEGGKLVKAHGWAVTGEAAMGRFETVSFAAHFAYFYGGSHVTEQGNVGIFDGARLVALIYGAKASDEAIGFVEALEGGGVRVWDGSWPSNPVGDIRAEGNDLRLGAVAAEGISRARSAYRERSRRRRSYSRSRSRSGSRDTYRSRGRRHRKEKEKSRSRSKSRVRQLAGLGLGAAAVAAAVGYANRKNKQNQQEDLVAVEVETQV